MRGDDELNRQSFRGANAWKKNQRTGERVPDIERLQEGGRMQDGVFNAYSMSGHERNHLFVGGEAGFKDVSRVSGADHEADARAFVTLDWNRDGRLDLAVANANGPLLSLFRNELGELAGNYIALEFEGHHLSDRVQESGRSPRDGYGARVEVTLPDGVVIKREHKCGQGFAAQNSKVMLIGIGEATSVDEVKVAWPSGRVHVKKNLAHGRLVRMKDDPVINKGMPAPPNDRPYAAAPGAAVPQ